MHYRKRRVLVLDALQEEEGIGYLDALQEDEGIGYLDALQEEEGMGYLYASILLITLYALTLINLNTLFAEFRKSIQG